MSILQPHTGAAAVRAVDVGDRDRFLQRDVRVGQVGVGKRIHVDVVAADVVERHIPDGDVERHGAFGHVAVVVGVVRVDAHERPQHNGVTRRVA